LSELPLLLPPPAPNVVSKLPKLNGWKFLGPAGEFSLERRLGGTGDSANFLLGAGLASRLDTLRVAPEDEVTVREAREPDGEGLVNISAASRHGFGAILGEAEEAWETLNFFGLFLDGSRRVVTGVALALSLWWLERRAYHVATSTCAFSYLRMNGCSSSCSYLGLCAAFFVRLREDNDRSHQRSNEGL
jgi:hypothetical protein